MSSLLLPVCAFVPVESIREMQNWDKEKIISFLLVCESSRYDYDYELLFKALEKSFVSPKTFFSKLEELDIDFDELRQHRLNDRSTSYPEKRFKPTHIYLLQNTENGFIKIGVTSNFNQRYKQLCREKSNDLVVIGCWESNDALAREKEFMDAFDKHRVHGEWFRLEAEEAEPYVLAMLRTEQEGDAI